MSRICLYDDSLPWLLEVLAAELSLDVMTGGVVLRDASGRLAFFADSELDEAQHGRVSSAVRERLGPYARPDRVVVCSSAPGAKAILADSDAKVLQVAGARVRYLDRRVVGADWLRTPARLHVRPPRFVFSSPKGGVGRSTALSVVAAAQAAKGRNVLVLDLDLEAPGVGSLLLTSDRLPSLGALDHLVEQNVRAVSTDELDSFVGTSGLTSGAGLVDVVPVVGTSSRNAPQNYMSKLSHAMVERLATNGEPVSVAAKIRAMLSQLEGRRAYDLVLIDARAGLAELAAGPLLGLGANVLLFGTAQPQALDGLRFLFAHFSSLVPPGEPTPWQALKMVHAKAQSSETHQRFKDDLWELFAEYLYEELEGLEGFNFDADDPDAPHNPIVIPLDTAFADWDPASQPAKLVEEYYTRTFEGLLSFVNDVLSREEE